MTTICAFWEQRRAALLPPESKTMKIEGEPAHLVMLEAHGAECISFYLRNDGLDGGHKGILESW
jgi:hypothetical protein